MPKFSSSHLNEALQIIKKIDCDEIEKIVEIISICQKNKSRIFFIGVGGSAGNCSHAVNDFRKILGIESYAPTDNVSELTARINDDGWQSVFKEWFKVSNLRSDDLIFVFSVGGGSIEKNISANIVEALIYAKDIGSKIVGIVGRDGGYTKIVADACVVIPIINEQSITPHTEAFQAVIWHLLVSHPMLKLNETKWESTKIKPFF